jgi:hypothetical protein
MGAAPSKDTFWTSDNGNQSTTRGGCDKTGCPPDHSSVGAMLHTMLAVLSTGPVGFSDAPNETDATLIMRTCDAAGNLLQPSKPLTSIDSTHDVTPGAAPSGYALVTHTSVAGSVWLHQVVSHQMNSSLPGFGLRSLDVWPPLAAGTNVAITTWDALQACAQQQQQQQQQDEGVSAGPCSGNVTAVSAPADPHAVLTSLPVPPAGADPFTPALTLIAPICASSGAALFGEFDKFATVSVQRFVSIACSSDGIAVELSGTRGEAIRLAWWAPAMSGGAGVAVQSVTFPGGPNPSLSCDIKADGTLAC